MKFPTHFILEEKGISVVGVLLLVGALGAAASGIGALIEGRLREEQQITVQQAAELARQNVVAGIAQERSWRQTILAEPSMACLRTAGAVCDNGAGKTPFSLRLVDGSKLVADSSISPTRGFDRFGNPCDGFNGAKDQGNEECPFRYVITWSCNGPCAPTEFLGSSDVPAKPKIFVEGKLEFNPKFRKQNNFLKPELYPVSVVRGEEERDLSATCRSVGGFFDQGKKHCAVAKGTIRDYGGVPGVGCDPATQYLKGLNSDGTPICANKVLLGRNCANRNAVVGLTGEGQLLCGKF